MREYRRPTKNREKEKEMIGYDLWKLRFLLFCFSSVILIDSNDCSRTEWWVITLLNKHRSEKLFPRFILEICLVLIDQGCMHMRVFVIFSQPSLRLLLLFLVEYVIVKVKVIIISSKYRTRNGWQCALLNWFLTLTVTLIAPLIEKRKKNRIYWWGTSVNKGNRGKEKREHRRHWTLNRWLIFTSVSAFFVGKSIDMHFR